ncbi:MAG: cation diffusion facilitator family transporter [Verrucomicrobiae bacterium]|nr:cation diffusion facilitator family transporter [Verrucomicrobiae bacterium]
MGKQTLESYREAVFASWLGIAVNALLALLKLAAGILGQSLALIADALESFSDIGTSLVIIAALNIARKPADENHPYGHGKAEALGSVVVSTTLLAIAVAILWNACATLISGRFETPSPVALWAALVSILVKEGLYQYKNRLASRLQSAALRTEAWHHRSDALSSLLTVVAILLAMQGGPGWAWADPVGAILVALMIGYIGIRQFLTTSADLMDEQPNTDLITRIRRTAALEPGALGVEKVLVRKSGLWFIVDLHLEVDPLMPTIDSHRLGHRVQKRLIESLPEVGNVLVHIEPHPTHGKKDTLQN